MDNEERFGLLVVGHGSSQPYNKQLIEDVAGMLSKKLPRAVTRIGFMNINKPSIKDGLDSFRGMGIKRVVVFPLFLAKGVHTTEDVPGLIGLGEGEKRITYDGFDIVYADPLGADDLIAELSARRIREAYAKYSQ
jgi:sirohydrochlorin cobalto/nickelchelatase